MAKDEKSKKLAMGALVGAAAGFVAGVLLAPKSGKETRDDLKKGAKEGVKAADKQLRHIHDELSKLVDKAEVHIDKLSDNAKKEAVSVVNNAKKTRDQAASVLAAVRSGNSTDEDLDMAVKNAQNALESLKKFFTK